MALPAETDAFVAALFERCTGGCLTLTGLPPDSLDCLTPSRHVRLADKARLEKTLARLAEANLYGWGAVIAIATRRADLGRYRRGARRDLAELPALFVDLDDPEQAQARLKDFPLPPSITVSSGLGSHAYWILRQPTKDFAAADRALRGLAEWLGGDLNMTVAQSMRLPGTINPKPGRNNALCRLVELHPERHYTLAQFEPYMTCTKAVPNCLAPRPPIAAAHWTKAEYRAMSQAVEQCLLREYGGFWKPNGWLSALCPFGHRHDRPGLHFGFHPRYGGHCFGRHSHLPLEMLAAQLRLC